MIVKILGDEKREEGKFDNGLIIFDSIR